MLNCGNLHQFGWKDIKAPVSECNCKNMRNPCLWGTRQWRSELAAKGDTFFFNTSLQRLATTNGNIIFHNYASGLANHGAAVTRAPVAGFAR